MGVPGIILDYEGLIIKQSNKMSDENKIKLSECRQIALLCAAIPSTKKAMGFRVDSKLISLSEDLKAQIEYHIGDELKEINKKTKEIVEGIRVPLAKQFEAESEGLSDEDKKALEVNLNAKISRKIENDEDLKAIRTDEIALWEKEIERDITTIEIEEKDYDERFGEPKPVVFMEREFNVDGYDALLLLLQKGVLAIKGSDSLTPAEKLQAELLNN